MLSLRTSHHPDYGIKNDHLKFYPFVCGFRDMNKSNCNSHVSPIHSLTKDKLSLDLFIKVEFTESTNYL